MNESESRSVVRIPEIHLTKLFVTFNLPILTFTLPEKNPPFSLSKLFNKNESVLKIFNKFYDVLSLRILPVVFGVFVSSPVLILSLSHLTFNLGSRGLVSVRYTVDSLVST